MWDAIQAQVQAHGYTVSLVNSAADLDGANGRTTFASKTVKVRADMDEAARVKTLIHELGHVLLHDPDTLKAAFTGKPMPERHHLEVEAESVAFIVADAHGLPTDGYTFPYVASWAGQDGTAAVRKTATRVAAAAKAIIAASTVEHSSGGHVPGVEQALARAAKQRTAARNQAITDQSAGLPAAGMEVA